MKSLTFLRRYFVWCVFALSAGLSMLLYQQNPGKAAVLLVVMAVWVAVVYGFKQYFWPSLFVLLLFLPFNITLQLPASLLNYDPYTNLIISNYLIPTTSVVDILLLLVLAGAILDLLPLLSRFTWIVFIVSGVYFILHLSIHPEYVTAIAAFRYLMIVNILGISLFEGDRISLKFNEVKVGFIKRRLALVIAATVLFQVVMAYFQVSRGSSVGLQVLGESELVTGVMGVSFWTYGGEDFLRGYGTFPHPNVLAGYLLLITLAFSLVSLRGFSFTKRRDLSILLFIAVYMLCGVGILLTLSRAALASYMLLLLLLGLNYILMKSSLSNKRAVMSMSLPVIWGRMGQLPLEDSSVQDRAKLTSAAISGIKSNPIFGIGSGYSVKIYDTIHLQTSGGFSLIQPVHNIFLLILLEQGVIAGVAIIALMLVFWLMQLIRSSYKFLAVGVIASIIIIGMLDHYLLTLPQGIAIFLLMNLLLIFTVNKK